MSASVREYVRRALYLLAVGVCVLSLILESAKAERQPSSVLEDNGVATRKVKKTVYFLVDNLVRTGVFLALSGIFAGLTIGIMCMDTLTLDIIADSGPEPDRTYASSILPLRRQGHRTLCTLILSNMLMNVLVVQEIGIIMDAVHRLEFWEFFYTPVKNTSQIFNFALSTIVILVFTEILPMTICKSKYSLRIAAAGSGLVHLATVLMYPVAVPFGALLDYFVPHDAGQIYDRRELRKLMVLHCETHGDRNVLAKSELQLLIAAMDFHEKKVKDIMTPMECTTTVNVDQEITPDLIKHLWSSGRSRFPVMSAPNKYTAILLVKDLLTAKAMGVRTIGELAYAKARLFATVDVNASLPSVLRFFQQSHTHMLLVYGDSEHEREEKEKMDETLTSETRKESDIHLYNAFRFRESMTDAPNIVGVVTLEDVVEELIKEEIYDEYDNYMAKSANDLEPPEATGAVSVPVGSLDIPSPIPEPAQQPRVNFYSFLIHPCISEPLTNAQIWAVAFFLIRAVRTFFLWHPGYVKMLLDECGDEQLVPPPLPSHKSSVLQMHFDSLGANSPVSTTPTENIPFSSLIDEHLRTEPLRRSHKDFLAQASEDRFVLYREGVEANHFTLILGGKVEALVGIESFPVSRFSFAHFGEQALTLPYYAPDFSAVVLSPVRLYRIPKHLYEKYLFYNTVYNKVNESGASFIGNTVGGSFSRVSPPQMMSPREVRQDVQSRSLLQPRGGVHNVSEENVGLLANAEGFYGTFNSTKYNR